MAHNRCPDCSAALRPDAQWCGLCFRNLRAVPAPVQPAPVQPAPQAAPAIPATTVLAPPIPSQPGAGRHGPPLQPVGTTPVQAGWPCATCSLLVPLQSEVCPSCGASFLAALQADSAGQAPRAGLVMRLPRAARIAAALALSLMVAVLVPLLLTLLG